MSTAASRIHEEERHLCGVTVELGLWRILAGAAAGFQPVPGMCSSTGIEQVKVAA